MRIAIVTTHPPGQGSLNEYAYHFIRFLRQKPEVSEVVLLVDELPDGQQYEFSPKPGQSESLAPVRVEVCWRFGAWNNALRILKAVKKTEPDVVFFNLQFATFGGSKVPAALGLSAPALVKAVGFPTVVLLHNLMETVDLNSAGFGANRLVETAIRFFGTTFTRLILTADLVAVTIPKYVEILQEKYGSANAFLVPHGSFEDEAFTPMFDPPSGPLKIMTFGKFGTYKRVNSLIEAFKLLHCNKRPPLELVIAGTDSPNAPGYLDGVRREYAAVPNLHFTGYVTEADVPRIFNEAAVVVFPYTSTTGSSGVLHQAGSYGKAAVLPRLGDFAELIAEEGYTGEFFEPDNPDSLAQAIANVIDNPARRRDIGTQNFMASRGLLMDQVVDWYLFHFESLLA